MTSAAGSGSPGTGSAASSRSRSGTSSRGGTRPPAGSVGPRDRRAPATAVRPQLPRVRPLPDGRTVRGGGLVDEERQIAAATGNPPLETRPAAARSPPRRRRIRRHRADRRHHPARRPNENQGRMAVFATYASAVLHNGLGRYDVARDAALRVFEQDALGYGVLVVGELAEAACRTGDTKLVESALAWLTERTAATPTDWGFGIEARVRALLEADEDAYRQSIEHLSRTSLRVEVARTHLLYGEWLRREGRRMDARESAADGSRTAARHGRPGLCRTGPPRAARHRGDGPQTLPRDDERPHRAGGTDRPAGPGRADQLRDRRRSCSSVPAPSSGICARPSPSSASPPAASSAARSPPPSRSETHERPERRAPASSYYVAKGSVNGRLTHSPWALPRAAGHLDTCPDNMPARRSGWRNIDM